MPTQAVRGSLGTIVDEKDVPIVELAIRADVRHPLQVYHDAAQSYFLHRNACPNHNASHHQPLEWGALPIGLIFAQFPELNPGVQSIYLCSRNECTEMPPPANCQPEIYCFQLVDDAIGDEMFDGEEEISAMSIMDLPHTELSGLWESLFYEKDVKRDLLNYASTAMEFSNSGVDTNIIGCNRLMFLHGPPGSGKTSLCKALAQKLSVRCARQFKSSQMLEINAHSLFSRWFSESGKLVQRLFNKVHELLEDPENLVILLVDEVESLAASRQKAMQASEPTDAIRVVNALLTQIDRLKMFPNALVMTTSNVTEALDGAFVDRADYKVFLGDPSDCAVYTIFRQSIEELLRVGLVKTNTGGMNSQGLIPTYDELIRSMGSVPGSAPGSAQGFGPDLLSIAKLAATFSGRTLRKLPFHAVAFHMKERRGGQSIALSEFFAALARAAKAESRARDDMDPTKNKVVV